VAAGGTFVSPAATAYLVDAMVGGGEALTARERDVLRLTAEGLSSKEIGTILAISPRTVETHRHRLMVKLHTSKVASLVRVAIREGLVEP